MIWKIFEGLCTGLDDFLVLAPNGLLRGHHRMLFVSHHETDVGGDFFSVRDISVWNSLPEHVVMAGSLSAFKSGLVDAIHPLLFEFL